MIVLLSGEISSGKTTLASSLVGSHNFQRIRTGKYLRICAEESGQATDREGLQLAGEALDKKTQGRWVAELAQGQLSDAPNTISWVLDSARRACQIHEFRRIFDRPIFHVHLFAPPHILKERFEERCPGDDRDEQTSYDDAISNKTELQAKTLRDIADTCLNTSTLPIAKIAKFVDDLKNWHRPRGIQ